MIITFYLAANSFKEDVNKSTYPICFCIILIAVVYNKLPVTRIRRLQPFQIMWLFHLLNNCLDALRNESISSYH
ncbi:hypothetical protein HUJ04_012494 [Dendroctonus ponderosae]|nr:hypothetical protein HUJ04_012494 [Dendroctonus ponderosae]